MEYLQLVIIQFSQKIQFKSVKENQILPEKNNNNQMLCDSSTANFYAFEVQFFLHQIDKPFLCSIY